jgi:hypothetical protein
MEEVQQELPHQAKSRGISHNWKSHERLKYKGVIDSYRQIHIHKRGPSMLKFGCNLQPMLTKQNRDMHNDRQCR